MEKPYCSYNGAIHIHTLSSDGTGDIDSITKAAKKCGLDFIIITDHNVREVKEGVYNEVIVISGEEISPLHNNHYLAFDIDKTLPCSDIPGENIAVVRCAGGFGFIAHPDENEKRKNSAHSIKWSDKSLTGDGIELWNRFSDWADNFCDYNVFTSAFAYFFRNFITTGPHKETVEYWDKTNNERDSVYPAIGGVDAHALKVVRFGIPLYIFSYSSMFKTVTNTICLDSALGGDFEQNKKIILNAVKSGNNIIIDRNLHKNTPVIFAENSRGDKAFPGMRLDFCQESYLKIFSDKKCEILIYKDGKIISQNKAESVVFKITEKGKYRAEMRINNRPWVFSNPVPVV